MPHPHWATAWCASVQGPYPVGNATAQPVLDFAFPDPATGAVDQTFRLVVKPSIWGGRARIRLSNVFGTRPITLAGIYVGMASASACLVAGSNRAVRFANTPTLTLEPGASAWSDPVDLPVVSGADVHLLLAHKLAVSFTVVGCSGPMTWHAKAQCTSYVSPPHSEPAGHEEGEQAFPFSTTSWFFLDALDMDVPADTRVVLAMGDSITDGTASTLNGLDRWPDILCRRLQATWGNKVAVVNAGIGGNRIASPAEHAASAPFPGGLSMEARLTRDVLSLSGITAVVWSEGTNDFSQSGATSVEEVQQTMERVVRKLRAGIPGVKVIGTTLHSVQGSRLDNHGSAQQEAKRQALNTFVREGGLFDAVADFDHATRNPHGPGMNPWHVPDSCVGGPGDGVHPNRAGYMAMAWAVPVDLLVV